ncbi:MAG: hypothetical protein ACI35R_04355 [Bacillus sp. (in: firmicutes)]
MKTAKIYALYKGEDLLADGTIEEISEQTGKTVDHIRFMTFPTYHKRCKPGGKRMQMVLLEDDEEEM